MKTIIANKLQTPDGTILHSRHRHDFVIHEDKNGKTYGLDGGIDYQRFIGDYKDCKNISVYSDDEFSVIRENLYRGSIGKNGDEPLKYIALKDMSDEHLEATIDYEIETRPNNPMLEFYKQEYEYRKFL